MTHISRDDVQHLAQLSSLQLTDNEVDALQSDITNILDNIQLLSELDTTDVTPTYQVTGLENIWRNDEIAETEVSREDLLYLAPDAANHQVKVPKVL